MTSVRRPHAHSNSRMSLLYWVAGWSRTRLDPAGLGDPARRTWCARRTFQLARFSRKGSRSSAGWILMIHAFHVFHV